MQERQSQELETRVAPNVEHLLALLRHLARYDPPPAIRDRLAHLGAERFGSVITHAPRVRRRWRLRTVPVVSCALAVAIVCVVTAGVVAHRRAQLLTVNHPGVSSPAVPHPVRSAVSPSMLRRSATTPRMRRSRQTQVSAIQLRKMVIPLPYSDSAVRTGTEVTVPILLSQNELMSLGVPVSPAIRDRQFIADLLLGDDGLPRAISVSLPPRVLKEKR